MTEESIFFSSASNESIRENNLFLDVNSNKNHTLPFLYSENDLFKEYLYEIDKPELIDINTILRKKMDTKNWWIYNFSVGEKFTFFDKIIKNINETPESRKKKKHRKFLTISQSPQ